MTIKFSSDELKEFAEQLPDLNITNDATARNLRNSSLLLLSTVAEGEYDDITDINVDKLISDYIESTDNVPSEASIQTYKSRFNSLIAKFFEYKQPSASSSRDSALKGLGLPPHYLKKNWKKNTQEATAVSGSSAGLTGNIATNHTFDAQFLLRPETGLSIEFKGLPLDLTNEEAERIASFLKIYARPQ
ncbi:hypothetical protein [Cronobacter malonaticus]|uniref:hypothetical protein n=1 Tax=Cronobacter malonaticus TaxID=413503 RepID=UPI000CFDBD16|nr:hypothetical protein [Cronobacter malonaticus]